MRGYVLDPTYRVEAGRPVIQLFGRLESGESFLVRDDRERPHFWIPLAAQQQAESIPQLSVVRSPEEEARRSIDGRPLIRVDVATPQDAPPARDRLLALGIDCFEADVRFAYRYLIDRGIRGSVEIEGEQQPGEGVDVVYTNPTLRPADWLLQPRVLSIDIETDPKSDRLLSIGLAGCGAKEVLLLGERAEPLLHARCFSDQRKLLLAFVTRLRELDPDILTGWNFIEFDLVMLDRFARQQRVNLALGRTQSALRLRRFGSGRGTTQAILAGRVVLDGIDLMRGAFIKMESYALDAVSHHSLGHGKEISGADRVDEILRRWRDEPQALVDYNLKDCELVLEILQHYKLIPLTVERSHLTGMPLDRVSASVASFDFLYLSELSKRGIAAPVTSAVDELETQTGGHVLEPQSGLHRLVWLFDFRSLYPSVIRTFNIDPLTLRRSPRKAKSAIDAPNGAQFSREPGILPSFLDRWMPLRAAAKQDGNLVRSQALKILMNSFYGVLGTEACRFADERLVNAITGYGRELLLWAQRWFEGRGYRVLYGDTDSLFVESGAAGDAAAFSAGDALCEQFNQELTAWIEERWTLPSRVTLEFEKLYLRLLLPKMKGGTGGARKRYAGLVAVADGEPKLSFTGMEVVRRDWTALARRTQREIYRRLFADEDLAEWLRGIVEQLRAGAFDDELVYRKSLRRSLDQYARQTAPHVAAAKKLPGKPPRVIQYVITTAGPEPIQARSAPLDREHYVQKQIRGVAEPLLELLGMSFDVVIGDDRQRTLF